MQQFNAESHVATIHMQMKHMKQTGTYILVNAITTRVTCPMQVRKCLIKLKNCFIKLNGYKLLTEVRFEFIWLVYKHVLIQV